MREILFKAKRVDNGEWVEGYLMDENYINIPFNDESVGGRFDEPLEIDPSTICQCTGLTDKNSKQIWESDIIVSYDVDRNPMHTSKIVFREGLATGWHEEILYCHDMIFKTSGEIGISSSDTKDMKVIGNIFDNPELLEVEDEIN